MTIIKNIPRYFFFGDTWKLNQGQGNSVENEVVSKKKKFFHHPVASLSRKVFLLREFLFARSHENFFSYTLCTSGDACVTETTLCVVAHSSVRISMRTANGRKGSSHDNAGPQLRVHGPRLINSSLLIRLVLSLKGGRDTTSTTECNKRARPRI